MKAVGIGAAGVAAFVLTIVSIMGGLKDQSQVTNANYARRMEFALTFLMTSDVAEIRTETANAIRSDFDQASFERLLKAATPPEQGAGPRPDIAHDAMPGQVQTAAVSYQALADELMGSVEALRSPAPAAH